MKIGKYEFASKAEADSKLELLIGSEFIKGTNDTVKELGFLVIENTVFDENLNQITPPVFSNKYSVDVLWETEEHPSFTPYWVEVVGNGSHGFAGLDYQEFKVR